MQVSRWQDFRWNHQKTTKVPRIITCLPLINLSSTLHVRDEPSYLLYKKQTQYSFRVTQTNSKAKVKGRTTPSPPCTLQFIKQGLCFITFPWGLQKFCKEFFDYCNTFINKRKWTNKIPCYQKVHYQRWKQRRMGRNTCQDTVEQNFPSFPAR